MLRIPFFALAVLLLCNGAISQTKSEVKNYPRGFAAGEAKLLQQWTESDGNRSSTVFHIDVPLAGTYSIAMVNNLSKGAELSIRVDGIPAAQHILATETGWQRSTATSLVKNDGLGVYLPAGRHTVSFSMNGNTPPLTDQVSFSRGNVHPELDASWQRFSSRLSTMLEERPVSVVPAADKYSGSESSKVLNNPEGNYDHAIDTAFSYSTFHLVYLQAGNSYSFSTNGSTKDPVLHLFSASNLNTYSWTGDDFNGTWEANITVTITVTGYYYLLARPYYASQSGTTNITQNGVTLFSATPIAGQRYATTPRTGDLNYFTAKLAGQSYPDTRIFTLFTSSGTVTGYNDDYNNNNGGTWDWGLGSRIRKNYTAGSSVVYVCAFNASRTGTCDLYMGATNATLPSSGEAGNFPLLKGEDAIQTAPNNYDYNCIAWSGGITTSWVWPPDPFSTWHVANDPLAGFDKYYSNSTIRYPGAWNYTRNGATAANAAVDLWKKPSAYTHASVTKPGNANPHGYDWESKPGSFDRTLHPRNALEKDNWYGAVSNYYKFTGTYAYILFPVYFKTDMDAVKAGVAVIDRASLTTAEQGKLRSLLSRVNAGDAEQFEMLYRAWDKTKAANASLSDPAAYCNNAEYERLAAFCQKNAGMTMPLVFDKYVNANDRYIGKLVWSLTSATYGKLLTEVKTERAASPNDAQGRYRIHGDHDNGVLYIGKILRDLPETTDPMQADEKIVITVSPNPVRDQFTVAITLRSASRVSIQAVSAQRRVSRTLQAETTLSAGLHRFSADARTIGGAPGDIIAVQVTINGVLHTVKALLL